jgi:hypothetical protein
VTSKSPLWCGRIPSARAKKGLLGDIRVESQKWLLWPEGIKNQKKRTRILINTHVVV